jgi:putative Holliday junction resolvase
MIILGIDFGDVRIGIAKSDPFGWTAQAIETITWKDSLKKPLERIRQLVKDYNIEKIVVGFPKNMNGTIGPRGEKTEEFIELLSKELENNVPIIKWDERLSSVAANRTMHELGVKTNKKKGLVDQIAAVYILQGYLDSAR